MEVVRKNNGVDWWSLVSIMKKNNRELYDAISSLLEMLEKLENRCILVGVTGINNCGKTSIIEKCKKILAEDFTVGKHDHRKQDHSGSGTRKRI